MHDLMLKEITAACYARQREGDCPTTPAFSVEQLEDAVVALQTRLRIALDPDDEPQAGPEMGPPAQPGDVTLEDCPIGLFMSQNGELCLKTEYGNNEGRIDAFIVSSGEFFWGSHPQTIANQRKQIVTPVDYDTALSEARRSGEEDAIERAAKELRRRFTGAGYIHATIDEAVAVIRSLKEPQP